MSVHLELSLHTAHCCSRHGCRYNDEQCPVFFGKTKQDGPCLECKGLGEIANPFVEDEYNRKTPVPPSIAHLTAAQMTDLLVDMLDTREVQERLAEAVTDVLRERLMALAEERRRGSYTILHPDVDDNIDDK